MEAGWYPTGQNALRWWDGHRWTEHVVYPEPRIEPTSRMFTSGMTLLTLGACAFFVTGLASMGDPSGSTRAGLTRQSSVVLVVPLLCPGERMTAITLKTLSGRTLWRSEGVTFDTASSPLGTARAGFHDTVEYVQPEPTEALELEVDSSQVGRTYVSFALGDVPEGSYLGTDGMSRSRTDFVRRADTDTPCGDPYGEQRHTRIVVIGWLVSVSFLAAGCVLLTVDRRRRRRAA